MEEDPVLTWLLAEGVAGLQERELLRGTCLRAIESGLPVARGLTLVDMLDPVFEGRGSRWRDDAPAGDDFQYGSSAEGEGAEVWRGSPFQRLIESGGEELRIRLGRSEDAGSTLIADLAAEGLTDYVAFVRRISKADTIGEMDCIYSSFATRAAGGFDEAALARLRRLAGALALALKAAALGRVARTLARVYLGHGAAATVLGGRILRGMAERVQAVLWFSDLRAFTAIADTTEPSELIPFLNDYAEAAIGAIHEAGGETLKLIGDGVLAVFRNDGAAACGVQALAAAAAFRQRLEALSIRRTAGGRPATSAYVGLHVGEVFYGNIGTPERLDFTVVGPAVNEVSRIAGMCRSTDRTLLVSEALYAALPADARARLVSTGRFALRGVGRAQHLYTLDPELAAT